MRLGNDFTGNRRQQTGVSKVNDDDGLKNDYDRIADDLEDAILECLESLRESPFEGDSTLVSYREFLAALRKLKHLHGWVEGLADTHRRRTIQENKPVSTGGEE